MIRSADNKPQAQEGDGNQAVVRLLGGLCGAYLFALMAYFVSGDLLNNGAEMWEVAERSHSMIGGFFAIVAGLLDIYFQIVITGVAATLGGVLGAVFTPPLFRGTSQIPSKVEAALSGTKAEEQPDWLPVGVVFEGQHITLEGCNPWGLDWQPVEEEAVELPHPNYLDQVHAFKVYRLPIQSREIVFAAAEVTANAWAFYIPGKAKRP